MNTCKDCITYAICKPKVQEYFSQKKLAKDPNNTYPYLLYMAFTYIVYQKCPHLLPKIQYDKNNTYSKLFPAYLFLHHQYKDIIQFMETNYNYIANTELLKQDIEYIQKQIKKVDLISDYPRNILQLIGYRKMDKYEYLIKADNVVPSARSYYGEILMDHLFNEKHLIK